MEQVKKPGITQRMIDSFNSRTNGSDLTDSELVLRIAGDFMNELHERLERVENRKTENCKWCYGTGTKERDRRMEDCLVCQGSGHVIIK